MTKNKRIALLTGGSGFLGSRLIELLIEKNWQVRALARSPEAAEKVSQRGAEPIRGDLSNPSGLLEKIAGVDAVFHSAAQLSFWGPWESFENSNKTSALRLAEIAREAGVPHFIHVSAASVIMKEIGPTAEKSDEGQLTDKSWMPYSRSKALGEKALLELNSSHFRVTAIRPPFIWGPGDSFDRELKAQIESRHFPFISGGHYPYSVCHIDNVCEALILAAEKGKGGKAYFVCDPEKTTARDFLSARIQAMGLPVPSQSIPFGVAFSFAACLEYSWKLLRLKGDPPLTREMVRLMGCPFEISFGELEKDLGYKPRITRAQGLESLRRFYSV